MPHPRLLALVTALILVGSGAPLRADYTVSQLQQIERLILRKDCAALWQFLQNNPGIMAGTDALSVELRTFADATARGQVDCFDVQTAQIPTQQPDPIVSFANSSDAFY